MGLIYSRNSSINNDSAYQWTQTTTCAHSDDAGVRCLGYDDVQESSVNCATEDGFAMMSTTETLGVLTGLQATALVAVTVGWIVSCVYWQRKITKK